MTGNRRTTIALMLILMVTLLFMFSQKKNADRLNDLSDKQKGKEALQKAEEPEELRPVTFPEDAQPSPAYTAPERSPTRVEATTPPDSTTAGEDDVGDEEQFFLEPRRGRFKLTFSTLGASLKEARLLDFPTTHKKDAPPFRVLESYGARASLVISSAGDGMDLPLDKVNYERVEPREDSAIEFRRSFAAGIDVTKRFEAPDGEARHILLTISFHNTTTAPKELQYEIDGAVRVVPEYFDRPYLEALVATRDMQDGDINVEKKSPKKL